MKSALSVFSIGGRGFQVDQLRVIVRSSLVFLTLAKLTGECRAMGMPARASLTVVIWVLLSPVSRGELDFTKRMRQLATPEGCARIKASDAADVGTIVSVNSVAKGTRSTMSKPCMTVASSVGSMRVATWLRKWNEGKNENNIKAIDVNRNDEEKAVMSIRRKFPEGTMDLEGLMSDDFRVLS